MGKVRVVSEEMSHPGSLRYVLFSRLVGGAAREGDGVRLAD
ncbi:hypothetical protein [Arthrobacter burdickii]|uniref:Uncharacterized protein n=1 Tax=Arthrobacter burdickii TaxID=3035920 RepID=A0ABT8K8I9_9MICC|nr:hypothetical protein [Arthrobacter burdickii]MDN4612812.1 hypothetical protein [Arthrobacter burdickii]